MKKIIRNIAFVAIIGHCTCAFAKMSIPSIERIHKKVEAAKDSAISLKDLIKSGDTKHLIINAEKGAIVSNGIFGVKTFQAFEQQIEAADATLNSLYWSNQQDLIASLQNTIDNNPDKAAKQLKDRIKQQYPQTRSLLITFAQALDHEEQTLKGFATTLLKLSESKNALQENKESSTKKLKALYEKHATLLEMVQKLTAITNTLLM